MIFDLHIHSKFSSDSILDSKKIVKIANRKGLSGVAITDHNTIKGGLATMRYREEGFFIIVGSEIKTEIGDLTGLFLNEEIKSRQSNKVIDEIKDQGGVVVLPHPFRAHKWNMIDEDILKRIDVIEVFNARNKHSANLKAQKLAKKNKLPGIAGSDAHFPAEIGLGKTVIEDISDTEDIQKAILKEEVKIVGDYAPLYLQGFSKILDPIKTKKIYRLPLVFADLTYKFMKKVV